MKSHELTSTMPDVETLLLEKLRFHVEQHIPYEMIEGMGIDRSMKIVANQMYLHWEARFVDEILAGTHTETRDEYETSVWATWWDGFKERFFPKWLLKRFPAIYKTIRSKKVTINYLICPHGAVSARDARGKHEHLMWLKGDHL